MFIVARYASELSTNDSSEEVSKILSNFLSLTQSSIARAEELILRGEALQEGRSHFASRVNCTISDISNRK